MDELEFIKFIESIGFKLRINFPNIYVFEKYKIQVKPTKYFFHNGSEWSGLIYLNNLTPLKRFERSIKFKKILK